VTEVAGEGPALELVGLVKEFRGRRVVHELSLAVPRGSLYGLVGPNGAGKTSMLNVINGFYHPQIGSITFKGVKRPEMRPYVAASQGISRTFQNIALFRGMSTLDNIMTGRVTKMHRNIFWQAINIGPARAEEIEHRKVVEEIIDFLEIQAIRKTPVGRLPYGLQKRVELARALAAEPELLLLDEPMAGVNPALTQSLLTHITGLRDSGKTVVFVEHDMDVVQEISDWVVVMAEGRVIAEGRPEAIAKNRAVIDAYLGEHHGEAAI